MAEKYTINFELNGKQATPKEWKDIDIIATFGDNLQPILEIDSFTFVNDDAQYILWWIENVSIFSGIPLSIFINSGTIGQLSYLCVLDLTEMQIISPVEIKVKIRPYDDLDLIGDRLSAFTFATLADDKYKEITQSDFTDVKVIVRKKFDAVETALASVSLFILTQQFEDLKKSTKEQVIDKISVLLSTPLQKPAEIFKQIALIILFIAYRVALIIALLNLLKTLYDNLVPKPVTYKGITLRKGLEKILGHIDVDLDCDIPELDSYVYLPSKTDNKIRANRADEGIPNLSDFGYQAIEFLQLVYRLFRARGVLQQDGIRQKLIIVPEKSDRLQRQSNYVMPNPLTGDSILMETYRYNTDELNANFLLSFDYDPSDEWTMPNARNTPFDSKKRDEEKNRHKIGVGYEITTDLIDENQPTNLLKGFEEIKIPMALGHRRDTLSVLEQSLKGLTRIFDTITSVFGGGANLTDSINDGKGRLLISHNSFNIPKLLVIENGLIPQNHRDRLSARYLYNNYHFTRSFKTAPEFSQKKIYENIKIPFGFEDFIQTQRNSYFTAPFLGQNRCKFRELKWNISQDFAICTIEVNEQYVNPEFLIETPIEA